MNMLKLFGTKWVVAVLLCPGMCSILKAQDDVPLQNKDVFGLKANETLEVEVLEITPDGAIPAEIHRPAGKFILLIVDRTPDHTTSFLVSKAAQPGDALGNAAPLLRVDSSKADPRKHRMATVISAPAGEFDLKSETAGKLLCKFVFE